VPRVRCVNAVGPGRASTLIAIRQLVSARCALASDGRLIAGTAAAGHPSVDLEFRLLGVPATLAVQIEARLAGFTRSGGDQVRIPIRRPLPPARPDLFLLALLWYARDRDLAEAWLIPSLELEARTGRRRLHHLLVATLDPADEWARFRCGRQGLAESLMSQLEKLAER
jgi:hypothetical protein